MKRRALNSADRRPPLHTQQPMPALPCALSRGAERGVSLVEALVALAVMSFGMLGIAGLQGSLRLNTDVSRQRSEAVRLAQESIEQARAFSVINSVAGKVAYNDLLASTATDTIAGTNTTYTRTVTVPAIGNGQLFKQVIVDIDWVDRTNTAQTIRLSTTVHRVAPELGGSLAIPGSGTPGQLPGGRHASIPRSAVPSSGGTSVFSPPGAPTGTTWVFNDTTGVITQVCLLSVCTTVDARLLSGYVNFATVTSQPTWVESETPPGTAVGVGVAVSITAPSPYPYGTPDCFVEAVPPVSPSVVQTSTAYYCLIRVDPVTPQWSGRSDLTGLNLATSASDADPARLRVCRYTSRLSNGAVGTGSPAITNEDHPYVYDKVKTSLANQNFLVMLAGNGSTAFTCPVDNPATTPLVSGDTFAHQP
jgi:Tfp pilus assembly protein PilV